MRMYRRISFLYTKSKSTTSTASSESSWISHNTKSTSCCEPLEDWLYWQQDETRRHCWMKVYAVLENEFLWLFRAPDKSKIQLLVQIAVSDVEELGARQLRIVDPNNEAMEIWLRDPDSFTLWRHRLMTASMLTEQHINTFLVDVKLPRDSFYRGSLISHHRSIRQKRGRCKSILIKLWHKWPLSSKIRESRSSFFRRHSIL